MIMRIDKYILIAIGYLVLAVPANADPEQYTAPKPVTDTDAAVTAPHVAEENTAALQTDATPKLIPGTTVKVTVYNEPDLSGTLVVDANGALPLPLIGTRQISDMDAHELASALTSAYQLNGYVVDPKINVEIIATTNTAATAPYAADLNAVTPQITNTDTAVKAPPHVAEVPAVAPQVMITDTGITTLSPPEKTAAVPQATNTNTVGTTPHVAEETAVAPQIDTSPKLTPGTKVKITVYNEPELSGTFVVDANGALPLPMIGIRQVSDLDTHDLAAALTAGYINRYVVNPRVHVEILTDTAGSAPHAVEITAVNPQVKTDTAVTVPHGEEKAVTSPHVMNIDTVITSLFGDDETTAVPQVTNTDKTIKTPHASEDNAILHKHSILKLIAGTTVKITVYNETDLSGTFVVDATGALSLPLIGSLQVSDWDERELEAVLTAIYRKEGYLLDPKINVEVLNFKQFYILGEVNKPGSYPYVPDLTVLSAVAVGGGFTYRAATDHITVIHEQNGQKIHINATGDMPVYPGDTVYVEERLF